MSRFVDPAQSGQIRSALPSIAEPSMGRNDPPQALALMREMDITDADVERRKTLVGLTHEDVDLILSLRKSLVGSTEANTRAFFDHIARYQGGKKLFTDQELLARAKAMKHAHLQTMLDGEYDADYVQQRIELALVYSAGELELKVFVGAFHDLMRNLGEQIMTTHAKDPLRGFHAFMAIKKIAFFDLTLMTDVLIFQRELTIRRIGQEAAQYARSLIESSLDPLVTISPAGKITDVNAAAMKVTGVPREKLIGSDFSDYFTEPEKAREGYKQVFANGFVSDYPLTIRHKDSHLTDVLYNASVYKDVRGSVLGVFAAARDVTAQKRAEAEVADQRSRELVRLAELERFQKLTVGRELKMIELKKEIADLRRKHGDAE
jgi:PAS domain S-box-containing protein